MFPIYHFPSLLSLLPFSGGGKKKIEDDTTRYQKDIFKEIYKRKIVNNLISNNLYIPSQQHRPTDQGVSCPFLYL